MMDIIIYPRGTQGEGRAPGAWPETDANVQDKILR